MAIKMRVLYASNKKKIVSMAQMIKAEFDLPVSDVVRRFCGELNKGRANNVALIVDGNEAAANKMKEILSAAGTSVADEVFYVKTSFLSFLDSITPEEKEALLAYAHRIVDNLQ